MRRPTIQIPPAPLRCRERSMEDRPSSAQSAGFPLQGQEPSRRRNPPRNRAISIAGRLESRKAMLNQELKDLVVSRILPGVQTPGQYVGGELNSVVKDHRTTRGTVCLAFPDTY